MGSIVNLPLANRYRKKCDNNHTTCKKNDNDNNEIYKRNTTFLARHCELKAKGNLDEDKQEEEEEKERG